MTGQELSGPNAILLRRGMVLVGEGDSGFDDHPLAVAFSQDLQGLGYVLAPDALEAVSYLSSDQAARLHREVVGLLREMTGVRGYAPMYPNFPAQVVEASDAELYWNAALHYFSAWVADVTGDEGAIWLPRYERRHRGPLADQVRLKVLRLGTEADLAEVARRIALSNTSVSPADRADLGWLARNGHLVLPEERIPNRENLALVGSLLLEADQRTDLGALFKTATDVLRLAVAMSGGDVSLAAPARFRSLARAERRALLGLLERCGSSRLEDMQRWADRWVRLGERLHPGESAARFPGAAQAFGRLRRGDRVASFASRVESAARAGRTAEVVELLAQRPGEFARRLDQLLRAPGSRPDLALEAFSSVAGQVGTPVLLQVTAHFRARSSDGGARLAFPKGQRARVHTLAALPPLPRSTCGWVVAVCEQALEDRFRRLPRLGSVHVDPELRHYAVPSTQRSVSRSLRTLERGSRPRLDGGGDTVRFFIWWKQKPQDRADLDLSAILYGPDWRHVDSVSYTHLRSTRYGAHHSGDITDAPNGACEFIDVDIPSAVRFGARYVLMSVQSYTRQRFTELAECAAGWMLREHPDSGEVFDPRTVADRIDVASDSTIVMPLVVDLVERRVIWADMTIPANPRRLNNIAGNFDSLTLVARSLTEAVRPSLYDLLRLHAQARGTLVASEAEADVVFSVGNGTPFDVNRIASEFMPA